MSENPQRRRSRRLGLAVSAMLIALSGCGSDEPSSAEDRAAELGFETGVDDALATASPGECMDASSMAATMDTAELVDCSSEDAFFKISSVGASCPDGDYVDVVTDDGTHVCGRLNVGPEDGCSPEAPCETDTVSVVGVATMNDPLCGLEGFGQVSNESTFEYPADDIVLCWRY